MALNLEALTPRELEQGIAWDPECQACRCVICGAAFPQEEVFPVDGRFYTARGAARLHLERNHPDRFSLLLEEADQRGAVTSHQASLLALFQQGKSDREIAGEMGVSPATVRRQRFTFREKAKQAKLYLALYALAFQQGDKNPDALVPVPPTATMADDRFLLTQSERDKILQNAFRSQQPLVLERLPAKEKKKVAVLTRIAQEFQAGRQYTEPQVNALLKAIHPDFATLRRYLIEYGFLARTADCSSYWKK